MYGAAKEKYPERLAHDTRNGALRERVALNPMRDERIKVLVKP